MAAFIAVVLGAACVFFGYALARFGREIRVLRCQRAQGAPLVIPFRGTPEFRESARLTVRSKITVLPANRAATRDVA